MSFMIFDLKREPRHPNRLSHSVTGKCARCGGQVYEDLFTLDDCYGVWLGRCPHCGALNGLDCSKSIRGYWSQGMDLTLPTNEEVVMNGLPADTPTKGWEDASNIGKTREELLKRYEGGESR